MDDHQRLPQGVGRIPLPALAPLIAGLLACVVGVQAWMLSHPSGPDLTWSGAPTPVVPAAELQVRFAEDATVIQFEAALEQAHARIVAGPLKDRSYLLDTVDPQAALRGLRESPVVLEVRALQQSGR